MRPFLSPAKHPQKAVNIQVATATCRSKIEILQVCIPLHYHGTGGAYSRLNDGLLRSFMATVLEQHVSYLCLPVASLFSGMAMAIDLRPIRKDQTECLAPGLKQTCPVESGKKCFAHAPVQPRGGSSGPAANLKCPDLS